MYGDQSGEFVCWYWDLNCLRWSEFCVLIGSPSHLASSGFADHSAHSLTLELYCCTCFDTCFLRCYFVRWAWKRAFWTCELFYRNFVLKYLCNLNFTKLQEQNSLPRWLYWALLYCMLAIALRKAIIFVKVEV